MQTLLKIGLGIIIITAASILLINRNFESNEGDKCVTLTITKGSVTSYDFCTDKLTLGDLVDEQSETLNPTFEGSKTDQFGRLLLAIDGYDLKANEFFFIYIDDVFGEYGIDHQPLIDGAHYELRLGSY